jgi:hypothetical protein
LLPGLKRRERRAPALALALSALSTWQVWFNQPLSVPFLF